MSESKKIRKRKFNFLKFLIFCLFIYLIASILFYVLDKPIKNIVILNNYYIADEEIIETAKIDDYPSFLKTFSSSMSKRIKKISLVKDVKIRKKLGYIVEIDIEEYKILYQNKSNNMYVLDNGNEVELAKSINSIPILINYVPDKVLKSFKIEYADKIDREIIDKISEIEYSPTAYDENRFLLYMLDGNEVYVTTYKLKSLNKYLNISKQLEGKNGILYLDSGNYFEIKN